MTTETKHTPTPYKKSRNGENGNTWRIWRNDPGQDHTDTNQGYACIASHVYGKDNAEFIVRACNSHAAFVEALKLTLSKDYIDGNLEKIINKALATAGAA